MVACVVVGVVNWHLLPIFTNPVLQTQAITPVDVSLQSDLGPHGWTPSAHGFSANKIHTLFYQSMHMLVKHIEVFCNSIQVSEQ